MSEAWRESDDPEATLPPPESTGAGDAVSRAAQERGRAARNSLSFFGIKDAPASGAHAVFGQAGREIGDFRLLELIGEGGMGQVWKAEEISLQRTVALKLVRPERVNERSMAYFAREARAGGRLAHPGIVSVHAHGEAHGVAWISMEFVEGAWTLRDFLDDLADRRELPGDYYRSVVTFVAEVADAMQAAHDAHVIHRDLKPQNILITPDEHPKLSDFGLARITDEAELSQTGELSGTYYYMSPEQVAARRMGIDHRTDVFSLGIVLYEMLSLCRPFEGETGHQIAQQILVKDPENLHELHARIPSDLAVICGKCLEKDQDRRYQSMAELAADIRRYLASEPIVARMPSKARKAWLWARRHPVKAATGTVATAALAVISFLVVEAARVSRALASERSDKETASAALLAKTREAEEIARQEKCLADLETLDELRAAVDELWPAHPAKIAELEGWLARAAGVAAGLDAHRAELLELRSRAQHSPEEAVAAELPFEDRRAGWWHDQLAKLVAELEAFSAEGTGLLAHGVLPGCGWTVSRRLEEARSLAELPLTDEWHTSWADAVASIATLEVYAGLSLSPQEGLVPIGQDPSSGLWEFWHVQSGARPERGAEGRLELTEDSGLVLVLLPPDTFAMGATREPSGPNHDPLAKTSEGPVHRVTLSAFFLSKYEMTQAQWERFTGVNPSAYQTRPLAQSRLHPVERVSWLDCALQLGRLGLTLPSEAQWEHAARAGTDTPWWTGFERESLVLAGAANLADQSGARWGATWTAAIEDWPELDDGWVVHAPVGTFAANPFGLHDVHGNVWEWCLDGFDDLFYAKSPELDPVAPSASVPDRVYRGGSFVGPSGHARSAHRFGGGPSLLAYATGVRPARGVEP